MKLCWLLYLSDGILAYFGLVAVALLFFSYGSWVHYFICFVLLSVGRWLLSRSLERHYTRQKATE